MNRSNFAGLGRVRKCVHCTNDWYGLAIVAGKVDL